MSPADDDDSIQRLLLGEGSVRVEMVRLTRSWREVVSRHSLPDPVLRELGKLTAAGVLLASALKFEGSLVLQIHGDGPVRLVVVECNSQGQFRATAKTAEGAAIADDAELAALVNQRGEGRFVVTLDPGKQAENRQPYQGIVSLEAESVSAMLESYMARSEQVPTRIWLAANAEQACGLLLQKLPDDGGIRTRSDLQAWDRLVILAATVKEDELLSLSPRALLHRLFWQETSRGVDIRSCRFACTCTRMKVGAMLQMLGATEVEDILAERGAVEVNCDFCNEAYLFDAVDCAQLFVSASGGAPATQTQH